MGFARFVVLAWLVAWSPSILLGQPLVQVRTRSVIRPDPPNEVDPTLLGGTLVDETDAPIANELISIVAAPAGTVTEARTDRAGHFDITRSTPLAAETTARFEGSAHIDPTELVLGQPSSARIVEPVDGELDLDQDVLALSIVLRAPHEHTVAVVDERGHELVRGRIKPERVRRFLIDTSRFPPPGTGRLSVVTTDSRDQLSTTLGVRNVTRFRSTVVDAVPDVAGGRRVVRGAVRDRSARGLAGQIVTLVGDSSQPVSTARTDETGAFVVQLPLQTATVAGRMFFVRHESYAPWWKAGRSPSLLFPPQAPAYPPGRWLLALFSVAVLAALVLGRSRTSDPASAGRTRPLAKRGGLSRLGAEVRYRVSARIISTSSGTAVPGARVAVSEENGRALPTQAAVSEEGTFELSTSAKGILHLEVTADGHEPHIVDIEIPHDGRWYGATITLRSLRDAALRHYERALLNPDPWRASHTTAREVLARHARKEHSSHNPLMELTLAFEQAYYAPRSPTPQDIAALSSMADALALPPKPAG